MPENKLGEASKRWEPLFLTQLCYTNPRCAPEVQRSVSSAPKELHLIGEASKQWGTWWESTMCIFFRIHVVNTIAKKLVRCKGVNFLHPLLIHLRCKHDIWELRQFVHLISPCFATKRYGVIRVAKLWKRCKKEQVLLCKTNDVGEKMQIYLVFSSPE